MTQCDSCRALAQDFAALSDILPEAVEVTPPPELLKNVLANLPARKKASPILTLHWRRWAATAAAVALVALAAWRVPEYYSTSSAPASDTTISAEESPSNTENSASPRLAREEGAVAPAAKAGTEDTTASYPALTGADSPAPAAASAPSDSSKAVVASEGNETESFGLVTYAADTATAQSVEESATESQKAAFSMRVESGNMDGEAAEIPPATGRSADGQSERVKKEDFEPITDVTESYFGILILTEGYVPQGLEGYPQENGDTWYFLPAAQFQALVGTLERQSLSFTLLDQGENIDHTQPQGLIILQAQ